MMASVSIRDLRNQRFPGIVARRRLLPLDDHCERMGR
jgi:hypothetical protein